MMQGLRHLVLTVWELGCLAALLTFLKPLHVPPPCPEDP